MRTLPVARPVSTAHVEALVQRSHEQFAASCDALVLTAELLARGAPLRACPPVRRRPGALRPGSDHGR